MRSSDFRRVSRLGRRFETKYFLIFRLDRGDGVRAARLGITVTRKVGGAVRRNRIKRLVREWFRHRQAELESCDLVVIAKRGLPARLSALEVGVDLDSSMPSPES